MEPLIEIPLDQWPILQDKLKDQWPLNVAGFYALHLNIKYPNVREAFQFKVYSPFGNMDNGFVATSDKDCPECILFFVNDNTRPLEEAILNTELLDWKKTICIDLVNSVTLNALKNNILPPLSLSYCKIGKVKTFFLERNTKPFITRCPPKTYLAPLSQSQIERVDETWPYKHAGSYFYFTTLAVNNLAKGLYSTDNNHLLAWVFLNEYNFICHLYCEVQHRRKGYAESLLKDGI